MITWGRAAKLSAIVLAVPLAGLLVLEGLYYFKILVSGEYFQRPAISFHDRQSPVAFLDGLQSYQSVRDVQQLLMGRSILFEESGFINKGLSPIPFVRPIDYQSTTITVQGFPHLGVAGRLEVEFFNDRLFKVRFFPSNPRRYFEAIAEKEGIWPGGPTRKEVGPHASMLAVSDDSGKGPYVMWWDSRLAEEESLWWRRHGSP